MKSFRIYTIGALSLFTILVALLFHSSIYQAAYKVAYLLWRIKLEIDAIDQKLIWAFFSILVLVICGIGVGTILRGRMDLTGKPAPVPQNTRLNRWITTFHPVLKGRNSQYAKWELAKDLFELYARIKLNHEGISQVHLKRMIYEKEFKMPDEVNRYFKAALEPFSEVRKRSLVGIGKSRFPLETDPKKIIEYIEAQNEF